MQWQYSTVLDIDQYLWELADYHVSEHVHAAIHGSHTRANKGFVQLTQKARTGGEVGNCHSKDRQSIELHVGSGASGKAQSISNMCIGDISSLVQQVKNKEGQLEKHAAVRALLCVMSTCIMDSEWRTGTCLHSHLLKHDHKIDKCCQLLYS